MENKSMQPFCLVCLSSDRNLYHIKDLKLFASLTSLQLPDASSFTLCWECNRVMKKAELFRRKAQAVLNGTDNVNIPLSNMGQKKLVNIMDICPQAQTKHPELIQEEPLIKEEIVAWSDHAQDPLRGSELETQVNYREVVNEEVDSNCDNETLSYIKRDNVSYIEVKHRSTEISKQNTSTKPMLKPDSVPNWPTPGHHAAPTPKPLSNEDRSLISHNKNNVSYIEVKHRSTEISTQNTSTKPMLKPDSVPTWPTPGHHAAPTPKLLANEDRSLLPNDKKVEHQSEMNSVNIEPVEVRTRKLEKLKKKKRSHCDSHMKKKHSEAAGKFRCEICELRFQTDQSMKVHLNTHHSLFRGTIEDLPDGRSLERPLTRKRTRELSLKSNPSAEAAPTCAEVTAIPTSAAVTAAPTSAAEPATLTLSLCSAPSPAMHAECGGSTPHSDTPTVGTPLSCTPRAAIKRQANDQAMAVERNAGSIRVEPSVVVPISQTLRGSVRRQLPLKKLEQSMLTSALEGAAEMSIDEEEGEEWFQHKSTHIMEWLQNIPGGSQTEPQPGPKLNAPSAGGVPENTRFENFGSEFDSEFDDEFDLGENLGRMPELAEQDPQLSEAMSRAMDAAVERLPGISNDFSWHADYDKFRGRAEVFSGPIPGPINDYDDPYAAFNSIFTCEFVGTIVRETNRYAQQTIDALKEKGELKPTSRLNRGTDTNVDEMYVFIALFILMGIDIRTSMHEYWLTSGILQLPYFRHLMSYNRYMLMNKYLHFTDNSTRNLPQGEGDALSAKLTKLAPVIVHLNDRFSSLYNLKQGIVIEESLTLFKGRLSWIQGIRSKAARFGIKSFELCETRTGYLYQFRIYAGKNPDDNDCVAPSEDLAGETIEVVLDLLSGLKNRGHLVTMDSFYNCPALTRYLKRLGFDNLGTLRPDRKHVPVEIAKVSRNVPKGTIVARHSGDVSCIAWNDSKMVNMISSYHTDETYVGRRAGQNLVKPIALRDYNNTMGGVDLEDQRLSMYLLERKRCEKWYMKIFKRMLNASVLNAFVMLSESLRRRSLPSMSHRVFRNQLAESLVHKHCQSLPRDIQVAETEHLRLRRDLLHVPLILRGNDNRTLCHICLRNDIKRKVNFKCDTCDEFMCLGSCWASWHSAEQLPGRNVFSRKSRRRNRLLV